MEVMMLVLICASGGFSVGFLGEKGNDFGFGSGARQDARLHALEIKVTLKQVLKFSLLITINYKFTTCH